jgi:MAF protein
MPPRRLYLASASPRRRQLLARLGVPYTVGVAPLDEDAAQAAYAGPADGLAEHLALAKARSALAAPFPSNADGPPLILAADTTVLLAGRVLGKPADPAEAVRMLRALRDRDHTVVTAVALAVAPPRDSAPAPPTTGRPAAGSMRAITVATRVRMREYTDAEIAAYVASGDPLDKAGAYGVQHPTFRPVAAIAGCYTSVVGLPLCATAALLSAAGLAPVASPEPSDPEPADPAIADRATAADGPGPCPFAARCRAPLPPAATDWAREPPGAPAR